MNTRQLRLTAFRLGGISLGCLVAATWGAAYGDAPTTTPPPHWFIWCAMLRVPAQERASGAFAESAPPHLGGGEPFGKAC